MIRKVATHPEPASPTWRGSILFFVAISLIWFLALTSISGLVIPPVDAQTAGFGGNATASTSPASTSP